ncbi:MAG: dipeptide/oligopeptide/nickel ABC transporter ATP-binding protein [Acidaminococcaceae bacterium]|nr:dipeptide/oligopeptide/nickel ABC transporter ATP-binding protein [Acidaminococcaceae bacterium]
MTDYMMQVENLDKYFLAKNGSPFAALSKVSFGLKRGECLGIVGESGCGKSTLAQIVCGLLRPTSGQLYWEGQVISEKERRPYPQIQLVFQSPLTSFDTRQTMGNSVSEGLRYRHRSPSQIEEQIDRLMEQCGLARELLERYPYEISGGQCQRLALVRALTMQPELLICDEITSSLDVRVQKQLMEFLLELQESQGLSFIFISHDLALVQQFCNQLLIMQHGAIVEAGATQQIIAKPQTEYTRALIEATL